jgi:hypothetical protein
MSVSTRSLPKGFCRDLLAELGLGDAINRRGVAVVENDADLRPVGRGDAGAQALDGPLDGLLHLGLEVRMVPRSTTSSGMMFQASPP